MGPFLHASVLYWSAVCGAALLLLIAERVPWWGNRTARRLRVSARTKFVLVVLCLGLALPVTSQVAKHLVSQVRVVLADASWQQAREQGFGSETVPTGAEDVTVLATVGEMRVTFALSEEAFRGWCSQNGWEATEIGTPETPKATVQVGGIRSSARARNVTSGLLHVHPGPGQDGSTQIVFDRDEGRVYYRRCSG